MLTTFLQSNAGYLHHAVHYNMIKVILYPVSEQKLFSVTRFSEWFSSHC